MDLQHINMIWLINKIKHKLIRNQKYKYAGYMRNLEIKLSKLFNVKR